MTPSSVDAAATIGHDGGFSDSLAAGEPVFSFDLLVNSVVAGILLGGFYAAVSLGISMTFGLLEVANIAHPAFVVAGAYAAYMMNSVFGLDPIVTGLLCTPIFYVLGVAVYRIYYASFERIGEQSLRGLVFFFGILFIIEVLLVLTYGVDYRLVEAPYIGRSLHIGPLGIALRLLVPCIVGVVLTLALHLFLGKTFSGRAIMGVSQDALALRLMGADPVKIKTIAFGLGIATASLAGALLIIIAPVEPSMGREYIGRAFAIAVLGGMGSIGGTLVAALILGVAESLTSTFSGPSWALAVSFGILLLALAVRPAGLFGR
jgi:branched-chain amino acid transport system permease protein